MLPSTVQYAQALCWKNIWTLNGLEQHGTEAHELISKAVLTPCFPVGQGVALQ